MRGDNTNELIEIPKDAFDNWQVYKLEWAIHMR